MEMDCKDLYPEAHEVLSAASRLAGGKYRKLHVSALRPTPGKESELRLIILDLIDEGWFEKKGDHLLVPRKCPHSISSGEVLDKIGGVNLVSSSSSIVEKAREYPSRREGYDQDLLVDKLQPSRYIAIEGETDKEHDPLIEEVNSGDKARRIPGRRARRRVDSARGSRYLDRPVAEWTAVDLAAYWDSETLAKLWGRSPDRTNLGALRKYFADQKDEGVASETLRGMIDSYIASVSSHDEKVVSLWKQFLSRRASLHKQAGNPAKTFDRGETDGWV